MGENILCGGEYFVWTRILCGGCDVLGGVAVPGHRSLVCQRLY